MILIVMAIPATQVLIAMYDTGGEDMSIEVRGYQWKWQYKYLRRRLQQHAVVLLGNVNATRRDL